MQPEKIGIYEIKSELGRGGMATVYRAYDPRFERDVALKVLPREMLHADPQFRLRFEREAKVIAQLEHSAIVPVYDVGEADGQPYFVMRHMSGGSLADRIKAGGIGLEEAVRIFSIIAPALDEAHSKGIIHRDIKPSNILFDRRNNPYISDFGIAKLTQAQAGNMTGSAIIGTPAYMAPEQAQSGEVDGRADIYSLGIILYEMMTGRQPYEADTPMAVAIKHIMEPVPHILDANPNLPEGMEAVIQKAMAKNKEDRYATAVEMANYLHDLASNPLPAPRSGKGVAAKNADAASKGVFSPLMVILPLIAIAAVAGGYFVFSGMNSPAATDTPVIPTSTSAPVFTETSVPTDVPTEAPVVVVISETPTEAPPTPTETPATPEVPVLGNADKIAFVAGSEIWSVNVDGSDLKQHTTDGAAKSDLQWLDRDTLLFLSGKTIKYYDMETNTVETLTSFPSADSLDAFRVSHDGSQVIIAMSNEVFVVPFDMETMKDVNSRSKVFAMEGACILPTPKTLAALQVQEARWSADDQLVAWLYRGNDEKNPSQLAEQVIVLNITSCNPEQIVRMDNFPGLRFTPASYQDRTIPDFDWDGVDLFVMNTNKRNEGWGELYLYNWQTRKEELINPIGGVCCYRDARWSPDGTYFLFAFQDIRQGAEAPTVFYYVPSGELGTGATFAALPLDLSLFPNPDEAPQPALRPVEE